MSLLRLLPLLCLSLGLFGCASFTPSGPLQPSSERASQPLAQRAQIEPVRISDAGLDSAAQQIIGEQLTRDIGMHVASSGHFSQLLSFPATLGEQDLRLHFEFSSLKGRRTTHPAYFPGALATLTLWIWVNGPIYVDHYDIAGNLSITDAAGKPLASSRQQLRMKNNTGLWDADYFAASGSTQLTRLVQDLLSDATRQLPR